MPELELELGTRFEFKLGARDARTALGDGDRLLGTLNGIGGRSDRDWRERPL